MAYTKLFNSIITSTIWSEDDQTRIIWITVLASCDQNGEVQASIPGLARIAGVPIEATEAAIQKFLSPDRYSRSKDEEGRRLEEIDGGWSVINHAKYRRMASKEDSKEKNAERQARFRKRRKDNGGVTANNDKVTQQRDIAESESESKVPPKSPKGESKGEWNPDPHQLRINKLYGRRDSTRWSPKELKSYRQLEIEEEELVAVEAYCDSKTGSEYRRKDILTLLNNWNGELDRARAWKTKENPSKRRGY